MTTFVVVHGAWSGSWNWDRVAKLLRARGHVVHVPTLSGLGERSHLAHLPINLTTHIEDIVNEMVWHDLDDVVLVGHSYGGLVITGVAERAAARLAAIVYLDAFIPQDGTSFEDFIGEKLSGPVVAAFPIGENDYPTAALRDMVSSKITPQPTGTFTERLTVTGAYLTVPNKMFIVATGWDGPFGNFAAPLRDNAAWGVHDLDCGHDVPTLLPEALSDLLETAVR